MKNKKLSFLFLSLSFIFSLFITSCDIKNPVDGIELRVKTLARTTVVSFSIYDGATQNLIQPNKVTVSFEGVNAGKIISMTNEPITNATTTSGILNFAVLDEIIPTPETPFKLTVVVNVDGYVSSSSKLFITSPGASAYSVSLANYSAPPVGVSSKETSGSTSSSTGATANIVANSGVENNSGASATITIPAGTILKDKNGTALSGEVKTRVTYFNPKDEQSLNSFPGGFAVEANGVDGSFVTAGFTAIDMTAGGTKVEQFGSGVNVDIDIPANLLNPETGNNLAPGDKIPLWSYDEETGIWTKEGEVTVPTALAKSANGKSVYKVSTTINHLSYWNLDWFQDACYEGISINVTGGCFPYLQLKAKRISDGAYFYSGWVYGNDRLLQLYRAPREVPVMIELWDYSVYPSVKLEEMQIDDLCGTDVEFPITKTNGMVEVSSTITAICHNSDGTVKSRFYPNNYSVYVRPTNNYNWTYLGQVINGQISACFKLGESYTFGAYIDGSWLEHTEIITKTVYDLEFSDLDYPEEMKDMCN